MTHINGRLSEKEGVLKMSFKKKVYRGEVYTFTRREPSLNHGGKGVVYDVNIQDLERAVVAKFFDYSGPDEDRRYERFKREISFLSNFKDMDGVIDIIDKNCPEKLPKNKDKAWYLMPKAVEYNVLHYSSLQRKLDDMISLAQILERLHSKEYAHRDIKPENILLLHRNIVLADFGLAWNPYVERLTVPKEKVGPYKILPPELEHIDDSANIDYRYSDVYLFAKVLWMTLKRDKNGFRGQYDRGDNQIYLSKSTFNACTLEPIHKLLEESTCDDISKRIKITDCIKLLEYQKRIVVEPKSIDPLELQMLQYEEESKKMIAQNKPDEIIYSGETSLLNTLQILTKNIIPNSVIDITNTENKKLRKLQATNFIVDSDRVCRFEFFINGVKIKEYLACVNKITYNKTKETYTLELGEIDVDASKYISFGESLNGFNAGAPKIYLSSKERIVLSKPSTV